MLRLFVVKRPDVVRYGEIEGFVVAADNEQEARVICDDNGHDIGKLPRNMRPEDLIVREIGTAHPSISRGEVLYMFVIED